MYVSNVRVQIGNIIPHLHTSIMTKDLSAGKELPISLSPGRIIALNSAKFDLTEPHDNDWASVSPRMDLDIWNINNDIILRITILRGTNKVFFNDHADKGLLDGWGQEKSVELSQVDVDNWQRSGVTISVHDCSTRYKEQYQILFGGLYPAPLFHMESMWNPYGIHVESIWNPCCSTWNLPIPHGICFG